MSGGDGAHEGVMPTRALGTILGGEDQPSEAEKLDPVQQRALVLAATGPPFGVDASGAATDDAYNQCCLWTARQILEAFLADPALAQEPTEALYDWDADPDRGSQGMKPEYRIHPGLHALLKERGVEIESGLTGYMWGWAVNTARRCVELGPVQNPALITIGEDQP